MRCSGESVIGLTIMPLSERLTRSTSDACSSIVRFLCTMPMPPCCAIAMARRDSVTVSMAALTSGTFRRMFRVRCVLTSTAWGGPRVARHQQHVVERQRRGRDRVTRKMRRASGVTAWTRYEIHPDALPMTRIALSEGPSTGGGQANHDTSCTSSRCRTGTDRCARPWAAVAHRLHRRIVATHPGGRRRARPPRRWRPPRRSRKGGRRLGGRVVEDELRAPRGLPSQRGRPPRSGSAAATTSSGRFPRRPGPSSPETDRSSPACTRRAGSRWP